MKSKESYFWIVILILVILSFSYSSIYRSYCLGNTERVKGIFIGNRGSRGNGKAYFKFKTVSGKKIEAGVGPERRLKKGDSVIILYSAYDPEIIEVKSK